MTERGEWRRAGWVRRDVIEGKGRALQGQRKGEVFE